MENFFHPTTGLYFFSALLQANAAIFAIVGVFMIFKLEQLQSRIDACKDLFSYNAFYDLIDEFQDTPFEDK